MYICICIHAETSQNVGRPEKNSTKVHTNLSRDFNVSQKGEK